MADTMRISLSDAGDREMVEQIGGVIKDALKEQGKGKWIGTSSAWLGGKAMAAIDEAIGGLDLFELFGTAWTTASALRDRADPAKFPVDKIQYVKLGQHQVAFDVNPKLVISVGPWDSQPIAIGLALSAQINAMELKIKAGHIESISGGACDIGLTMKLGDRVLMPRKTIKTFELNVEHRFRAPGLPLSVGRAAPPVPPAVVQRAPAA